jgi:AcrR family transcriptional regulator
VYAVTRIVAGVPRPRSLTDAGIAAAALAVIERDGIAGLSMRAVATEMGVGTMSLYRYVDGRDQLEGLVIGLVLDAVDTRVPAGAPWEEQVTTLVGRVWEVVRAHPAVVSLLLTRRHGSEGTLRWGEAMLAALAEGGFAGEERAIAFRALLSYVLGAVQVEHTARCPVRAPRPSPGCPRPTTRSWPTRPATPATSRPTSSSIAASRRCSAAYAHADPAVGGGERGSAQLLTRRSMARVASVTLSAASGAPDATASLTQ